MTSSPATGRRARDLFGSSSCRSHAPPSTLDYNSAMLNPGGSSVAGQDVGPVAAGKKSYVGTPSGSSVALRWLRVLVLLLPLRFRMGVFCRVGRLWHHILYRWQQQRQGSDDRPAGKRATETNQRRDSRTSKVSEVPLPEWTQWSWSEVEYCLLDRSRMLDISKVQPMHTLTLEFYRCASLEKSFQRDWAEAACTASEIQYLLQVLVTGCFIAMRWFIYDYMLKPGPSPGEEDTPRPSPGLSTFLLCEPLVVTQLMSIVNLLLHVSPLNGRRWFEQQKTVMTKNRKGLESTPFLVMEFHAVRLWVTFVSQGFAVFWLYASLFIFDPDVQAFHVHEALTLSLLFLVSAGFSGLRWIYLPCLFLFTTALALAVRWVAVSRGYSGGLFSTCADGVALLTVVGLLTLLTKYQFEAITRKDFLMLQMLFVEGNRSEVLLYNILPPGIVEKLKESQSAQVDVEIRVRPNRYWEDEMEGWDEDSVGPSILSYSESLGHDRFKQPVAIHNATGSSSTQDGGAASGPFALEELPVPFADPFEYNIGCVADSFASASILFSEVVGFPLLCKNLPVSSLVDLLNELFNEFDSLSETIGLEKIKTMGDCYMAAGGLPEENEQHAAGACRLGLHMVAATERLSFNLPPSSEERDASSEAAAAAAWEAVKSLQLLVGVHSGPCVAGVIGRRKFIYDVWGDTVNTASRMETNSRPGCVHISAGTYEELRRLKLLAITPGAQGFEVSHRGHVEVKGKGVMNTYWLERENDYLRRDFRPSASRQGRGEIRRIRSGAAFSATLESIISFKGMHSPRLSVYLSGGESHTDRTPLSVASRPSCEVAEDRDHRRNLNRRILSGSRAKGGLFSGRGEWAGGLNLDPLGALNEPPVLAGTEGKRGGQVTPPQEEQAGARTQSPGGVLSDLRNRPGASPSSRSCSV